MLESMLDLRKEAMGSYAKVAADENGERVSNPENNERVYN